MHLLGNNSEPLATLCRLCWSCPARGERFLSRVRCGDGGLMSRVDVDRELRRFGLGREDLGAWQRSGLPEGVGSSWWPASLPRRSARRGRSVTAWAARTRARRRQTSRQRCATRPVPHAAPAVRAHRAAGRGSSLLRHRQPRHTAAKGRARLGTGRFRHPPEARAAGSGKNRKGSRCAAHPSRTALHRSCAHPAVRRCEAPDGRPVVRGQGPSIPRPA
jgi:hypothetical protein